MSELKPCPCDLNLLNDRILNLGSGLATMPENGTMQVNKAFLTAVLGYMEELLGMRRAKPDNEPLTLEELREMAGEPAWCCYQKDNKEIITDCRLVSPGAFGCIGIDELYLLYRDYGKTWLAYRRKPEREGGNL